MTQKMPRHIANNFIYKEIWNSIKRKEDNASYLFIGNTGTGKSTAAIRICSDNDPTFSLERICFTQSEFFKLIDEGDSNGKIKRGHAIIFDEAAGSDDALDSRTSLSKTNRMASQFTTISRAKGLLIIYCTPLLTQVDKRVRTISVKGVFNFKSIDRKVNRSKATFYHNVVSGFATKEMRPKPRIKDAGTNKLNEINEITIPLPKDRSLVKAYKRKKDEFISGRIKNWKEQSQMINARKDNSSFIQLKFEEGKKKLGELVDSAGAINTALIRAKLNVGETTARNIKTLLTQEEETRVL